MQPHVHAKQSYAPKHTHTHAHARARTRTRTDTDTDTDTHTHTHRQADRQAERHANKHTGTHRQTHGVGMRRCGADGLGQAPRDPLYVFDTGPSLPSPFHLH